jgi:hypothetical protein
MRAAPVARRSSPRSRAACRAHARGCWAPPFLTRPQGIQPGPKGKGAGPKHAGGRSPLRFHRARMRHAPGARVFISQAGAVSRRGPTKQRAEQLKPYAAHCLDLGAGLLGRPGEAPHSIAKAHARQGRRAAAGARHFARRAPGAGGEVGAWFEAWTEARGRRTAAAPAPRCTPGRTRCGSLSAPCAGAGARAGADARGVSGLLRRGRLPRCSPALRTRGWARRQGLTARARATAPLTVRAPQRMAPPPAACPAASGLQPITQGGWSKGWSKGCTAACQGKKADQRGGRTAVGAASRRANNRAPSQHARMTAGDSAAAAGRPMMLIRV